MHTAHVSHVRSAMQDYYDHYEDDDSEWLTTNFDHASRQEFNPHVLEHHARATELLEEDDEDAAIIHHLLEQNMVRAARDKK